MANRGGFTSKLGFIMAAAGSAVGLGNIWKFPYEVGNGGGAAFVMVYLIFCFVLCFPVMVTEIAIGRKTQKNPVGAFKALGFPNWAWLGLLGIFCGVIILSFYNVIAGWAFGYFFEMITSNFEISNNFGAYTSDVLKVGSYAIIFMLATAYFVGRGVSGGIEKLARILMPSLVIMIVSLVIYSFTLPNAIDGLKYYLIPDLSKMNANAIGGALRQAFFSLSLGMGALITYGSYVGKSDNIVSSAAWITLTDVGIAFISGLMIFPLVAFNNGGVMNDLSAINGPGLIFVTLPNVFANLGAIGPFVGGFFFILLSFAALTSTVSLLEVPVAYAVDEYKMPRKRAVAIVAGIVFVIGIPSMIGNGYSEFFSTAFSLPFGADNPSSTDFLSLVASVADTLLLIGGALIVFFAAYVWKKHNLQSEIASGYEGYNDKFVSKLISLGVTVISPIVLFVLFIVVVLNNFFGFDLISYLY
jgi:neurotransmitter:Na+ symporter, NSS family